MAAWTPDWIEKQVDPEKPLLEKRLSLTQFSVLFEQWAAHKNMPLRDVLTRKEELARMTLERCHRHGLVEAEQWLFRQFVFFICNFGAALPKGTSPLREPEAD